MKEKIIPNQAGGLYTVPEAAALLKCGSKQIYTYISAGLLPAMKLGRLKIRPAAIERFLAKWEGYDLTDPMNPVKLEQTEGELEAG